MIHFESDYVEGAHPSILEAIQKTNMIQTTGYGVDDYCLAAKQLIKQECQNDMVDVHFLVGGTQTNLTWITSVLRPYQGVIAPHTSHIQEHETGAIEAGGHRIICVQGNDGKLNAKQVDEVCRKHYEASDREHTVQPGMVFISHPTETGTLYSKEELIALRKVCDTWNIPLYLDGARLGYGIMANTSDMTMADICKYTDAFYIGGTKIGLLFGEAIVIRSDAYKKDFRYMIKQRGGMLAKGRLLGIQFQSVFENGLYYKMSKHAIDLANHIEETLREENYTFLYPSYTNQLFPILSKKQYNILKETYIFTHWEEVGEHNVAIRICTSWATTNENVQKLLEDLKRTK